MYLKIIVHRYFFDENGSQKRFINICYYYIIISDKYGGAYEYG